MIGERDIETVVTGIRPGEKVHEILVSEEEAHRTSERAGHYVIEPMLPELQHSTGPRPLDRRILLRRRDRDRQRARLTSSPRPISSTRPWAHAPGVGAVKVMTVVGTRPELIRLSLVFERLARGGHREPPRPHGAELRRAPVGHLLRGAGLPEPDAYLGIRRRTSGEQIGEIIARSEAELLALRPDALLILGDTNSGLSAIAAARHDVPIFHMEAGNRCFDWRVPEEKNRKLIDHISDWLLPYTPRSREYLLREGIAPQKIFVSGNPITDILERFRPRWEGSDVVARLGLADGEYVLVTAHRQETVDVPARLRGDLRGP